MSAADTFHTSHSNASQGNADLSAFLDLKATLDSERGLSIAVQGAAAARLRATELSAFSSSAPVNAQGAISAQATVLRQMAATLEAQLNTRDGQLEVKGRVDLVRIVNASLAGIAPPGATNAQIKAALEVSLGSASGVNLRASLHAMLAASARLHAESPSASGTAWLNFAASVSALAILSSNRSGGRGAFAAENRMSLTAGWAAQAAAQI